MVLLRFDRPWLAAAFMLSLLFAGVRVAAAGAAAFPVYECIKPNVAFWKEIYSKYPSSQGLIHDSVDLGVVYEVVDLEPETGSAARERNSNRIKAAKTRYEEMLLRFAEGVAPQNAEERRVAALFGHRPAAEGFRQAATRIRFQLGQKDRFLEGVIRSGAYLEQMREIVRSYGLPTELAYLPHVESSFNYRAYSKFGAAGIWQFTQETGKRFLTIDYAVDERRDPIRATHAAARLLKENHEKLGDWPLALTAYNHGVNGMRRAKEAKGDYPTIFREYESGLFKFASRNFYAEFLAACEVAENYRAHFGDVPLQQPVASHEVSLQGHIPLARLLEHFKVDREAFRKLNPALREPVYLGEKHVPHGYQVRLPLGRETTRLAGLLPQEQYQKEQKRSSIYRVRRGDTVSAIARRHRISAQELRQANRLDKRGAIFVGQNLRIPKQEEPLVVLASGPQTEKRLASLVPQVPPGDPLPEAVPVTEPSRVRVAVVPRSGQVESSPASASAVPVRVARAGSATPEKTAAGQGDFSAAVPALPGTVAAAPVSPDALANPAVVVEQFGVERVFTQKGKKYAVVRVAPEETLGHYAEWLGVAIPELRRLNRLSAGQDIRTGQRVTVPLGGVGRERFEELRFEFHREMEEDFFAAYRVERVRRYQVKPGDNIWRLCQQEFEIPFWLLRKYNTYINGNTLKPGVLLLVPVVEKKG
ncbi:MAG: LysM peptidoglycan-binding domain-containing protein [Thermodesulfobacteriota bacterium]